jgi:hypothetical protein
MQRSPFVLLFLLSLIPSAFSFNAIGTSPECSSNLRPPTNRLHRPNPPHSSHSSITSPNPLPPAPRPCPPRPLGRQNKTHKRILLVQNPALHQPRQRPPPSGVYRRVRTGRYPGQDSFEGNCELYCTVGGRWTGSLGEGGGVEVFGAFYG